MNPGAITESQVLDALRSVMDPDLHRDIVSLGFIKNLKIEGSLVAFDVNLTTPACPVKDRLREQSRDAVLAIPGVRDARVNMTAEVRRPAAPDTSALRSIRNIVAVGSGKGGVGKSTVASNLAASLAKSGARVGLLDADIYGPSIPIMMRSGKPAEPLANNTIEPGDAHGVRVMSMGYLSPGDQPLIWRGPMAHKALQQSLLQVNWGELDYLIAFPEVDEIGFGYTTGGIGGRGLPNEGLGLASTRIPRMNEGTDEVHFDRKGRSCPGGHPSPFRFSVASCHPC